MKLERVWVICLACGKKVEAVVGDGRVKGYCAVDKRYVDFAVETQRIQRHIGRNPTTGTKTKIFASLRQDSDIKSGVVRDYLRGDKAIAIQDRYGISPGTLYRLLHDSHVKLRAKSQL